MDDPGSCILAAVTSSASLNFSTFALMGRHSFYCYRSHTYHHSFSYLFHFQPPLSLELLPPIHSLIGLTACFQPSVDVLPVNSCWTPAL